MNNEYSDGLLKINPIGLNQDEMYVLKSICHVSSLSRVRPRRYTLENAIGEGERFDVCVVNGDCPSSIRTWLSMDNRHQMPTLFLKKDGVQVPGQHVLSRPFIPSRLLSALDGIAACWANRSGDASE